MSKACLIRPYLNEQWTAWALATIVLTSCQSAGGAQPRAQWIWANPSRYAAQVAYLRKSFDVSKDTVATQLLAIGDFSRATIFVNAQQVAVADDYGPRIQVDVSQHIKPVRNVMAVRADGSNGPSAIAIRLSLTSVDGTVRSITSDATWLGSLDEPSDRTAALQDGGDWQKASSFGAVGDILFGDPGDRVAIHAIDDYTQWKQALAADISTDPATFRVPEGYQIRRLRSARQEEGSWVSLAFDPQGRLLVAKEDVGILRMTLSQDEQVPVDVETINHSLQECRGMLFVQENLYVNANKSRGLYRLRDTTDDDQFDEVRLIQHWPGGDGHGRNDLVLGPDRMIYSIHGDAVDLPSDVFDHTSPFRIPRPGRKSKEGHVLRMDLEGKRFELLTSGLRNGYGIDFNTDGEMFTYDADAEHDMGAPWYRPTRVQHLLPGGDYGWRGVTNQWPPYYPDRPDATPPNLDIGKGSPTAVQFGTNSHFPPKYRRALFILDWAYGRIIAVHMTPRGSSYAMSAETMIRGRPLNVTDLTFGPDGAMYFVTGGRKTQSGLYRVSYVGPAVAAPRQTTQQLARSQHADEARKLRRQLESYHGRHDPHAIDLAWPHLDSPDPWLRHAARIAVEHQPLELWQQRAFDETRPTAALTAFMTLAASGQKHLPTMILDRLLSMPLGDLTSEQQRIALRTYELCLSRSESFESAMIQRILDQLNSLYPSAVATVNQPLSRLLVRLNSSDVVRKTLQMLSATADQAEQLHYLFVLREAQAGWTSALREAYFERLRNARHFSGGAGMPTFIQRIQNDALATLTQSVRQEMQAVLGKHDQVTSDDAFATVSRPIIKKWTMHDLSRSLPRVDSGRNFEQGYSMFAVALCIRCHRIASRGTLVAPDLSSVSSRFSRTDLLESILLPSKVVAENYQSDIIQTADGRIVTGQILPAADYRSPVLHLSTDPLAPEKMIEISKRDIQWHKKSSLSRMPEGLLDTLSKEEILDLLAYIEAGGQRSHPSFQP